MSKCVTAAAAFKNFNRSTAVAAAAADDDDKMMMTMIIVSGVVAYFNVGKTP